MVWRLSEEVVVNVSLGGYMWIKLKADEAVKLIEQAYRMGRRTRDLEETMRILRNFEEFYRLQVRKNKSFLTPPKELKEELEGKVLIDKVRLEEKNGERFITILFDKRVKREFVKSLLEKIGFSKVIFNEASTV